MAASDGRGFTGVFRLGGQAVNFACGEIVGVEIQFAAAIAVEQDLSRVCGEGGLPIFCGAGDQTLLGGSISEYKVTQALRPLGTSGMV